MLNDIINSRAQEIIDLLGPQGVDVRVYRGINGSSEVTISCDYSRDGYLELITHDDGWIYLKTANIFGNWRNLNWFVHPDLEIHGALSMGLGHLPWYKNIWTLHTIKDICVSNLQNEDKNRLKFYRNGVYDTSEVMLLLISQGANIDIPIDKIKEKLSDSFFEVSGIKE